MLNAFTNGLPVIGHIKGGVHYACKDFVDGDLAMKAASHSTGVLIGGTTGFVTGGPMGAMVGGITGGLTIDSLITEVDSKLKKTYAPSGHLAALANLMQKTQDNEKISGEVFDLVTGLLMDGIVGGMQENVWPIDCAWCQQKRLIDLSTLSQKILALINNNPHMIAYLT